MVGARQLTARGGESEVEDGGTGERPEVEDERGECLTSLSPGSDSSTFASQSLVLLN